MGVDDGCHLILLRNVMDQFVYDKTGLGVQTAVWLIAKKILGIEGYGTGNSHTLLHTATDFAGKFVLRTLKVHTFQAELGTAYTVGLAIIGKHFQREHDILQHGHGIEKSRTLENHAHLAADKHLLALGHSNEVAAIIQYLSAGGDKQAHDILHQHCLSTSALADDKIGLSVLENGIYINEHILVLK